MKDTRTLLFPLIEELRGGVCVAINSTRTPFSTRNTVSHLARSTSYF